MRRSNKTLCTNIPCNNQNECDYLTCWHGGYGCETPGIIQENTTCQCSKGTQPYEYGCKGFQYNITRKCLSTIYHGNNDCSLIELGCKNPETYGEFCICGDGYMVNQDASCMQKPESLNVSAYSKCIQIKNNFGRGNCYVEKNCVRPFFIMQKYCVYKLPLDGNQLQDSVILSAIIILMIISMIGIIIAIIKTIKAVLINRNVILDEVAL